MSEVGAVRTILVELLDHPRSAGITAGVGHAQRCTTGSKCRGGTRPADGTVSFSQVRDVGRQATATTTRGLVVVP